MKQMAKYPGLLRDKRRHWTVRVTVPAYLQAVVAKIVAEQGGQKIGKIAPKRELWRTTGTSDKAEADKKYPLIRAELDAVLLEARRRWQPDRKVSEAELHQLVRGWFHRWNRKDASRITDTDIISWKDALVASSLDAGTIKNHLVIVKAFFTWATKNKRIASNPAADVEYRPKSNPNAGRLSYDDDDARLVLLAARRENEAHKRWAPWLCAFTGARLDEIVGAMVRDIDQEGEIWFLRIDRPTGRWEAQSKTGRQSGVSLHPAVINEGFLDYVKGLPMDGPLFPNVTPDRFGKRGGNGTKTLSRWVRKTVGITDKRKAPSHSWRHRFADQCRAARVPRDVRFALDGHAGKDVGDRYGSEGYPSNCSPRPLQSSPAPFSPSPVLLCRAARTSHTAISARPFANPCKRRTRLAGMGVTFSGAGGNGGSIRGPR